VIAARVSAAVNGMIARMDMDMNDTGKNPRFGCLAYSRFDLTL
jgi:hypothetical protein